MHDRTLVQVSTEEAQAYADENGLVYWETSAKTNQNVSELFQDIAARWVQGTQSSAPKHRRFLRCCGDCADSVHTWSEC